MEQLGVSKLRSLLENKLRQEPNLLKRWAADEKEVVERFGTAFAPANLASLTPSTLEAFLDYKNNRHWKGIYRHKRKLLDDFEATRQAIGLLVDENHPLPDRFNRTLRAVRGLGRAVATAILLVVYPDRYGVWNKVTEEALQLLGLSPAFPRGATDGQRYQMINRRLNDLAQALALDLWALDALWYEVLSTQDHEQGEAPPSDKGEGSRMVFGNEHALRDFLAENWGSTDLSGDWDLYTEADELVGVEYRAGTVGRIDLLARQRSGKGWLVVELKLGRSSDQAVGQLLRYMGWVERHLAKPGEKVEGAIVAESFDDRLRYAIRAISVRNIRVFRYRVHLDLEPMGEDSL